MRALISRSSVVAAIFVFVAGVHAQTSPGGSSQTQPQTQAKPGAPQAPARDSKAVKAATGVIKGRVVAADSGAPLRRARLVLAAPGLERPFYAATDGQGRYEFGEVPAGRYTLTVSKSGYVTLQYGQRRAFESGKPIEIADAAVLDKVDIALPRGGVISGTVVDDVGEPAALVRVTAFRSRFEEGKRKLVAIGRDVETNDLGQYRLFGLQPGTYFVGTRPTPGPSQDGYPFAPAYYPNTLNVADAQPVMVRMGQEQGGINLVQPPGRLARITGTVIDLSGRPLMTAAVSIVSPSTGYMLSAPVTADGTFALQNIAPGEYGLAAVVRGPTPGDIRQTMIPLAVTGEDLSGFVLQMTPGSHVAGRIVTEDGNTPPGLRATGVRVDPFPLESQVPIRIENIGTQGIVNDDWTFEMNGIGGTMLFRPRQLPAGYTLKSVSLDGRDITDTPIDIKGSEDINGVQVVITNRVTEMSGTVSDTKGEPVREYAVIVFADDAARWKWPSRFLATGRPDQQGRFKISSLPPGRYLAVALEYLEEGQSEDPIFLEALRPLATSFTLGEGERKTLDLRRTNADGR